jgi:hypothetical protein
MLFLFSLLSNLMLSKVMSFQDFDFILKKNLILVTIYFKIINIDFLNLYLSSLIYFKYAQ